MYIKSWLATIFRVSYLQSSSFNVSRATCTKVSPIFLKKFDFFMALDGSTSNGYSCQSMGKCPPFSSSLFVCEKCLHMRCI